MASSYPTGLDAFTTGTLTGIVSGSDHGNKGDAINKIEAELGTDPSGSSSTVKARLDTAEAGLTATLYVATSGSDSNTGLFPGAAKLTWAAAITALPSTGGRLIVGPGTYNVTATVEVPAGKAVEIVCCPGVILRASSSIAGPVLRYHKITDKPGVGAKGLVIDMNSLATIGLELEDCWMTEHWVRVIGVDNDTAVQIEGSDTSFGNYYNRVKGQVVGTDVASSIGVHMLGAVGAAANANVVTMHVVNCATGIKQGANCDANHCPGSDCTSNAIGYDVTSGVLTGEGVWEEGNTTNGFIVRAGAKGLFNALYSDGTNTAQTTGQLLVREAGVDAWVSNTVDIDQRAINVPGSWGLRERVDPDAGQWQWIEDSVRTVLTLSHAGWWEMPEISEPANATANTGRVFFKDNGSGKTQLCVRFASGATQVVVTEP